MHPKFLSSFTLILLLLQTTLGLAADIECWKRFEVLAELPSIQGNPFDLEFEGIFTSPSGKTFRQIGFFAGKNTCKVFFMPNELGRWTYRLNFADLDFDSSDLTGEFNCIESDLYPPLVPIANRWAVQSGKGDFPVIWNPPVDDGAHWGFRGRKLSDPMVQEAIQYADEVVGARLLTIGDLFVAPIDWAKSWPQNSVPFVEGKEGEEFYFPFWDQLNAKLDAARDRNMGMYVMLYTDDALKPDNFGMTPYSKKEMRFFRYVVARLACYPHIIWDSGIDISEYRNKQWIEWYTSWFAEHDPWHHPIGSRSGGGSGNIIPSSATYFSAGGASLPSRQELLKYLQMKIPVAHTDHWRPFIDRGNWTNDKIRKAIWRCALTGAQAVLPDYNQGNVDIQKMKDGAKYIGYATHFFREKIYSDLTDLQPADELLLAGNNAILAASLGKEYLIYVEGGGKIKIDLAHCSGVFDVYWFNPRTGESQQTQKVQTGKILEFDAPTSKEDWVLHIYKT